MSAYKPQVGDLVCYKPDVPVGFAGAPSASGCLFVIQDELHINAYKLPLELRVLCGNCKLPGTLPLARLSYWRARSEDLTLVWRP